MKNKLNLFIMIAGFVFLIGIMFDVGISYYMYKQHTSFFLDNEAHIGLVGELEAGVPWFETSSVLILVTMLGVYIMYSIAYYYSPTKSQTIMKVLMVALSGMFLYSGIRHILGGLTWWPYL